MISLTYAGWDVDLLPALGGAVAALRRGGADIFRPTAPGADHPLLTACFPLVPYANRIADGRFAVDGEHYALPRNVEGQDHPLHGVGWLVPWTIDEANDRHATLRHDHAGDVHWPWAYAATQSFMLDDDGLRVTLSVTNHDARAMPVSLGFHPYFMRGPVTTVRFAADGLWLVDAGLLPTEQVAADRLGDWAGGDTPDRATLIDNSYTGWSGEAIIGRADGDLRLAGGGTPFLHLFMPPGEDFFCVEPVTAMPDGLNRAAPVLLAPGESRTIAMSVTAAG
ncbi:MULTISPECIES: aldose 1-epimerase [unclassified Sphingomonas]|uniref:aldose 1-epimerase n=1 Tax=unclassified Sphingomonas TaxID=196159 RepID=UPI002269D879|nr:MULTISPECIES: aldose 1-epimerase [unclassified Sphingomonas]